MEQAKATHNEELNRIKEAIVKQQADMGRQQIELEEKLVFYKRKLQESETEAKQYKEMINPMENQHKQKESDHPPVSVVAQAFCDIAGKRRTSDLDGPI